MICRECKSSRLHGVSRVAKDGQLYKVYWCCRCGAYVGSTYNFFSTERIEMSTTTKTKDGFLIIKVPPHLRSEFKSICARRGKSMQQAVTELLEREVKKAKP